MSEFYGCRNGGRLCASNLLRYQGSVATLSILVATMPLAAVANPQGANVVAGNASIVRPTASKLEIRQTTDKAVIDWNSFDIGVGEHTEFKQPSSSSHTLNRVKTGTNASQILGKLSANGKVTLVNPNGVFFGKNAMVDVNGLIATTADIDNADFMAGRYNFTKPGNPNAKIVNEGQITARQAGLVGLVAPHVENSGVIEARTIQLSSGDTMLDLYGDGLLGIAASDAIKEQVVNSSGKLVAHTIVLSAAEAQQAVSSLVTAAGELTAPVISNQAGIIRLSNAKGVTQTGGAITAKGGSVTIDSNAIHQTGIVDVSDGGNAGTVTLSANTLNQSGIIKASSSNAKGGNIDIVVKDVVYASSGQVLDVSGRNAGGNIKQVASGSFSSGTYKANSTHGIGGNIQMGGNIGLLGATIEAKGATGGGIINVGGNWQGGKALPAGQRLKTSEATLISQGTILDASSSGQHGNGGEVVVWSDAETEFYGSIKAKGGSNNGAGGRVEVSGANANND